MFEVWSVRVSVCLFVGVGVGVGVCMQVCGCVYAGMFEVWDVGGGVRGCLRCGVCV